MVDRCAGTAQLKKLGFCRAKTRSRTFRMTLSLIFQNKGTAGGNHHCSLFFLNYSLLLSPLMSSHRFVEGLDIRAIAERVMHALFEALAMRFEFSLQGITETEEHK